MNGYLNIRSTSDLNLQGDGERAQMLRSNLNGIEAVIVQMKSDGNLFSEDGAGKTTASREVENLEAKREEIQGRINAYLQQSHMQTIQQK